MFVQEPQSWKVLCCRASWHMLLQCPVPARLAACAFIAGMQCSCHAAPTCKRVRSPVMPRQAMPCYVCKSAVHSRVIACTLEATKRHVVAVVEWQVLTWHVAGVVSWQVSAAVAGGWFGPKNMELTFVFQRLQALHRWSYVHPDQGIGTLGCLLDCAGGLRSAQNSQHTFWSPVPVGPTTLAVLCGS